MSLIIMLSQYECISCTIQGHYMYIDGGKGEAHEHATLQGLILPAVNQSFQEKCKVCVLINT